MPPLRGGCRTNPAAWSFVGGDNNGSISPEVESVRQGFDHREPALQELGQATSSARL
jgi:hypothetical protein